MADRRASRVLMIQPRFASDTFWSFEGACEFFGARYPAPPLGLITVAALLPKSWSIRLLDRNIEEMADGELDDADLVMVGGMLPQIYDIVHLIDLCRARGKPIVVGGPAATSSPELFANANFRVLGEAESVIDEFVAAWENGANDGLFVAPKFEADVTKTPVPRFDLLKVDSYLYIGVQYSRGCPFMCEFCDIIELYGRVPRTKTNAQMLAELETLYQLGYRGHVDFVDDNLIGNKKAVKQFLPALANWLEQHDYAFEFTTEASLNLADDVELLILMNRANFVGVFVGIESPDSETLVQMKKKQNTRRNIADSVLKLYESGLYVTAGFILGFDSERASVAAPMIDLIEQAAIPACMVGLLTALPQTQLARRLEKEDRLRALISGPLKGTADQCTQGLNFDTLRPRREILLDYKRVLEAVYDPVAYANRLRRLSGMLNNDTRTRQTPSEAFSRRLGTIEKMQRLMKNLPEPRDLFWQTFTECFRNNPKSIRYILVLMALYLHLGPFSRYVIAHIDEKIAAIDAGTYFVPERTHHVAPALLN